MLRAPRNRRFSNDILFFNNRKQSIRSTKAGKIGYFHYRDYKHKQQHQSVCGKNALGIGTMALCVPCHVLLLCMVGYDALAEEIFELRELKHKSELDDVTGYDHIKRIAELQDFIKDQPTTLTEYDENLVNRLLQKITVFDSHFVVEFKSGVSVEIEG